MAQDDEQDLADFVSHQEFAQDLPRGRLRLVVNPRLARSYVVRRLWLHPLVTAIIVAGLALALTGASWPGALLVGAGIMLNRMVSWNSARILVFLAARDPSVYEFATQNALLEVRRVA